MSGERGVVAEMSAVFRDAAAPPVVHVTNIHVSVSSMEIAAILGRARQLIDTTSNLPRQNAVIEWFQSLSVSPITAKQLQIAFAHAIEVYEKLYGKIPDDPNFQLAPIPDKPPPYPAR